MTSAVIKSFYDLSARTLSGKVISFKEYKGKVVLIENTASLWGTTTRDFLQMNELKEKFGDNLAVLAFPCNQFGHQENNTEKELLKTLRHVRPGNNFEPKMELFGKVAVNGSETDPIFKYLKERLPAPSDDTISFMDNPQYIIWSPVCRYDITWNFEKFLIGKDGQPFKRYSRSYETKDIKKDITSLMK